LIVLSFGKIPGRRRYPLWDRAKDNEMKRLIGKIQRVDGATPLIEPDWTSLANSDGRLIPPVPSFSFSISEGVLRGRYWPLAYDQRIGDRRAIFLRWYTSYAHITVEAALGFEDAAEVEASQTAEKLGATFIPVSPQMKVLQEAIAAMTQFAIVIETIEGTTLCEVLYPSMSHGEGFYFYPIDMQRHTYMSGLGFVSVDSIRSVRQSEWKLCSLNPIKVTLLTNNEISTELRLLFKADTMDFEDLEFDVGDFTVIPLSQASIQTSRNEVLDFLHYEAQGFVLLRTLREGCFHLQGAWSTQNSHVKRILQLNLSAQAD
jgi:hypothetical protein